MRKIFYLIFAMLIGLSAQSQTTLLPFGSSWKYLDNGSNQGTAWRTTTFNDAVWVSGNAQLGYGDGDEATVVSYGPNSSAKYATTYFRKVVNIADVNAYANYIFNIKRDDGMVVYVNGTEVWRNNMPTGTIAYNTWASTACSDDGNTVQTTTLTKAASMLVTGNNTIAIEVHQSGGTSSDLSCDFQLQGQTSGGGGATITRGPYQQKLNASSVTLRWRTSTAVDSKVTYGTVQSNLNLSATVTGTRTEHTVTLSGLSSATKYYYSIGTTAGVIQSGVDNNFMTAPVPGTPGKYTFWVTGDCGNNSTNQQNVLNQYNTYIGNNTTHAWLLLGDNAYSTGTDAEYTSSFFNKYQSSIMKHAPLFPAPGNHDYAGSATRQDDHNIPYYSIFDLPSTGQSGGVASNTEAFYAWDYGNIHFLSLDSYGEESNLRLYDTTGVQALWVKQDLAANTKPWVVAYWHHAPYSMTSHNSDTESELINMRAKFIKMIERLGVDLILCGHSHGYERSKLMKGHYGLESTFSAATHNKSSSSGLYDGSTNSCPYFKDAAHTQGGTVYVVAGSAGQLGGTQASFPHNAMHYSNATNGGSMVLEFDDNRLDAKFLCADGVIRDKFTIVKNSNKESQYTITSGQNLPLTASWNGSYVWSTGATTKTINVAPTVSTTYTVRDQYTCMADTFNVTVSGSLMSIANNSTIIDPLNVTVSGDGMMNIADGSNTQNEVSVFPNPFNNLLNIKYTADKQDKVVLELIDMSGTPVTAPIQLPNIGGNNAYQLNTSNYNLKTGIYLVRISTGKYSRVLKVYYTPN